MPHVNSPDQLNLVLARIVLQGFTNKVSTYLSIYNGV